MSTAADIEMSQMERFTEELISTLTGMSAASGEHMSFEKNTAVKTNDNMACTIVCRPDNAAVGASIPIGPLYDDYMRHGGGDIYNIATSIMEMVSSDSRISKEDMLDKLKDMQYVHDHLRLQIVNVDLNRELLAQCPYQQVTDDLAVIVRIDLSDKDSREMASTMVNNNLIQHMMMTREELFTAARSATESNGYTLQGLGNMLFGMIGDVDPSYRDEIIGNGADMVYVLTNDRCYDGAALIACPSVMTKVTEQLNDSVYIIPCSRHETLIVPESTVDNVKNLLDMVIAVNHDEGAVSKGDYLADNVYHYDLQTHRLEMCFDKEGREIMLKDHVEQQLTESISKGRGM